MARSMSPKAQAFALAIAASTAFVAIPASAQQTAGAGTSLPPIGQAGEAAAAMCARRGDTTLDCIHNERNRIVALQTAAANARTQQANNETECAGQLKALRTANPAVVERGRAILGNTPASTYGLCKLLAELRNG